MTNQTNRQQTAKAMAQLLGIHNLQKYCPVSLQPMFMPIEMDRRHCNIVHNFSNASFQHDYSVNPYIRHETQQTMVKC